MNKIFILILVSITSCQSYQKVDLAYVLDNYLDQTNKIEKIEYLAHQIDSINANGVILNNVGLVVLEKEANDKIFGFSFYARQNNSPNEYIYDEGKGFEISTDTKTFEISCSSNGFIGSPGGQLVVENIFQLDTLYKSIKLIVDKESYNIKYEYEIYSDYDSAYSIKIIELDKQTFLPMKVTKTTSYSGVKHVRELRLSNIKINDIVENTIENKKAKLLDFKLMQDDSSTSVNINTTISEMVLKDFTGVGKLFNSNLEKLTLIDFWEVWCGSCIKSLPEVEKIKNTYGDDLDVIGIITQDVSIAQKLLLKKNITFKNYLGTSKINLFYNINSYPRYFLVDKNGLIINEYFGFDKAQIENDIENYL